MSKYRYRHYEKDGYHVTELLSSAGDILATSKSKHKKDDFVAELELKEFYIRGVMARLANTIIRKGLA